MPRDCRTKAPAQFAPPDAEMRDDRVTPGGDEKQDETDGHQAEHNAGGNLLQDSAARSHGVTGMNEFHLGQITPILRSVPEPGSTTPVTSW